MFWDESVECSWRVVAAIWGFLAYHSSTNTLNHFHPTDQALHCEKDQFFKPVAYRPLMGGADAKSQPLAAAKLCWQQAEQQLMTKSEEGWPQRHLTSFLSHLRARSAAHELSGSLQHMTRSGEVLSRADGDKQVGQGEEAQENEMKLWVRQSATGSTREDLGKLRWNYSKRT